MEVLHDNCQASLSSASGGVRLREEGVSLGAPGREALPGSAVSLPMLLGQMCKTNTRKFIDEQEGEYLHDLGWKIALKEQCYRHDP